MLIRERGRGLGPKSAMTGARAVSSYRKSNGSTALAGFNPLTFRGQGWGQMQKYRLHRAYPSNHACLGTGIKLAVLTNDIESGETSLSLNHRGRKQLLKIE